MKRKRKPRQISAENADRLLETEDLLAKGLTPRRVAQRLAKRWGMSENHVRSYYVEDVLTAWGAEASKISREDRRTSMREMLIDAYCACMLRTRKRKRKRAVKGEVVTIEVEEAHPDTQGAKGFAKLLMDLDGLNDQRLQVEIGAGEQLATMLAEAVARRKYKKDLAKRERRRERARARYVEREVDARSKESTEVDHESGQDLQGQSDDRGRAD